MTVNTNLQVFNFESHTIRTVEIDGVVWFVAKDVATALGYSNTADAVRNHCRKAKSLNDIGCALSAPPSIDPQAKMILESDLYRLTMKSTLESAEKFQDWVVEEVLPSIRKTGSYNINTPKTYIEALEALLESEKQKELLTKQTELLNKQIEEDKPYTNLAKMITSQSTITRRDWLGMMKDDSGVNVKERELTDFLIMNKYCYRDQLTNELRAYAQYAKYFKLEYEIINGAPRALLKVTGEGVLILTPVVVNYFLNLKSNTVNTIMNTIVASTNSRSYANIDGYYDDSEE